MAATLGAGLATAGFAGPVAAGFAGSFPLFFFAQAASASAISLSASSCAIWLRRTIYCTRSRALSMEKARRPAAAPMTSFIAAAILLPASREISCALAAISAIVSRTS